MSFSHRLDDALEAASRPRTAEGAACLTWGVFREGIEDSELSTAGKVEYHALVDGLRRVAGAGWLDKAWQRGSARTLVLGILAERQTRTPFRTFVAFALSVLGADGADGFEAVLSDDIGDAASWSHASVQLELATVCRRAGARVTFGPENGAGRSSDLRVEISGGRSMLVEVTVRGLDGRTQAMSDRQERPSLAILTALRRSHGCQISLGHGQEELTDAELSVFSASVADAVDLVGAGLGGQSVVVHGGRGWTATIERAASSAPVRLSGPIIEHDEAKVLRRRLDDKAAQAAAGDATWVYLLHSGFAFYLGEFAEAPPTQQLAMLQNSFSSQLSNPAIAGLVFTTRTALPHPDHIERLDDRSVAIVASDDRVTHAALILGSTGTPREEVRWWQGLYADHLPGWLRWQAAQLASHLDGFE